MYRGFVLKFLVVLFLALLSPLAASQTALQCAATTIYYEARGEPIRTQKAVLQILHNRASLWKMSLCDVVRQPGQFLWSKRKKNWKITPSQLDNYFRVLLHSPVIAIDVLYFNNGKRLPYGKARAIKIGGLYFT